MELFKLFGSILVDNDQANKSIAKTDEKAEKLGTNFTKHLGAGAKVAGAAIGGMAVAVGGAAVAVGGMINKSIASAGEMQKMADVTGFTTERIQELAYVGKSIDMDFETLMKSQTKLTRGMSQAAAGNKAQAESFKTLGIHINGADGHLRDAKVVMLETIDALGKMNNETERDALSLKIFGKSAMELNPLIKAGSKEIARLTDEAQKSGAVMSNEAVKGLDDLGDSIESLQLSAKSMVGTLASSLVPQLQGFVGIGQKIAVGLSEAIKTGNFQKFGDTLANAVTEGLNNLSKGITKFVPVVVKVLKAIIGAIVVAIPVILPALTDGVVQLLNAFIDILASNGVMIINAAIDMVTTLIDGIVEAIPKLIPLAVTLILGLANALIKALPKLIDSAIQIILALVNGLITALPIIIAEMPKIIKSIIDGLLTALPKLLDAAIQIIMALIDFLVNPENIALIIQASLEIMIAIQQGLWNARIKVLEAIGKLIFAIIGKLVSTDWGAVGLSILKGIAGGLSGIGTWFTNTFTGAWNNVKKVFSGVGGFFAGIWNTITSSFTKIGSSIGDAVGGAFKVVVNSIIGFAENTINGFLKGINSAIGLINNIPGVEIAKIGLLNIPKMSVGTRYLPNDMLIQAHKGEMIVPKSENPYANSGGGATLPQMNGDIIIPVYIEGNLAKTIRLTSEQLRYENVNRNLALGV